MLPTRVLSVEAGRLSPTCRLCCGAHRHVPPSLEQRRGPGSKAGPLGRPASHGQRGEACSPARPRALSPPGPSALDGGDARSGGPGEQGGVLQRPYPPMPRGAAAASSLWTRGPPHRWEDGACVALNTVTLSRTAHACKTRMSPQGAPGPRLRQGPERQQPDPSGLRFCSEVAGGRWKPGVPAAADPAQELRAGPSSPHARGRERHCHGPAVASGNWL